MFNFNVSIGVQLGGSGGAGIFLGFNAPTNDVFTGPGSSINLSGVLPVGGIDTSLDLTNIWTLIPDGFRKYKGKYMSGNFSFANEPWNVSALFAVSPFFHIEAAFGYGGTWEIISKTY